MSSPIIRAAALSLLLCLSAALHAEIWDGTPFTSDPKAMLAAAEAIQPLKPEEGVIVLLDETVVTFDASGRSTRVDRLIFRVIDESAVEGWSEIGTSWSPWYHERPQVDARVIAKDGSVHRLDPRSFGAADAEDEPDMFSDTRILSGPLPAVAPGSVVEQTITYREKNPLYAAGVSERHQFGRWVETRQSRLTIDYPSTLALRMVNRTTPAIQPRRTEDNGVTHLVFETGPRPALQGSEWYLPTDVTEASYVAWSTGKSWQDVAARYSEIIDQKIGDGSAVAKITAKAVGDAKDPREIAARLVAVIARDIRYAGVEFGEGSIMPRTPTETLSNKYGDCKDKATLLVAMLRQAGVRAHTALLRSGIGYDVEPDLPGLGHFNHVIVVTEGESPIWIDPTDEFARAGELPDSDQGRLALIAKNDTVALTPTPLADSSANRTIERREFLLAEDGKAIVTETSEYSGSGERSMRRYYTGVDRKSAGEELENYAEQVYLSKKLTKWELGDSHDLAKAFRIHMVMDEAARGTTAAGEAAVGIFFNRLIGELPSELRRADDPAKKDDQEEKKKIRRNDYLFAKPHILEVHYKLVPPPGYVVRVLPPAETLKLGTATFTKNYTVNDDGSVLADFRFDSGPRRITAAQFEELRLAAVKVDNEKPFLFYFDQVGRKYLDAGEVGKAVAEFRRLALLHPKEALHHNDIARTLLAGGFGSAARAAARKAIAVEPKSAKAYATLGNVLASDLIGRPMRKGVDLPGAVAAYRKARELDPKDGVIRAELAFLLEHASDGTRFGAGAPLDQAVQEYLDLKKDVEEANDAFIDRELMILYATTNRWDDLRKLLSETTDTESKDMFRLVLAGATNGGAAAIEESASVERARRRDVQFQAGSTLALLRDYAAAAELVGAAAQGAPNATELRQQADLLHKAVRQEQLKLQADDPISVVKLAMRDLFNGKPLETLTQLYSTADVIAYFNEEGMHEKMRKNEHRAVKRAFAKKDPQSMLMVDLALSAIDVQRDGDEKVGLRLRGRIAAAGDNSSFTIYAVKENGQYRLAGSDDSAHELGIRAYRLAENNELTAARQWLDWAREHVSGGSDDPVNSPPFAGLWTRGTEASAEEIRIAAATLIPDTKKSSELAAQILEKARPGASPEVQWRIDQALVTSYAILEKWEDMLAASDRLVAKFPDSGAAFSRSAGALMKLGRHDEARTRALARLKKLPGDIEAQQVLGTDALRRGAYEESLNWYTGVLDRANPGPGDYNDHAWASIFARKDLDAAIENARHAASGAPTVHAILNTLATLYAEQGRSSEARDALLRAIEQTDDDEPNPADWYIVGRIAETYGVLDAAAEAYQKVTKPADLGGSAYELAQQRLAGLKR
jgi:tetratricopeptide (TPR) repeat protein